MQITGTACSTDAPPALALLITCKHLFCLLLPCRIQTLSQVLEAKAKAEEAANTSAALLAAERKAKQYRHDSTAMLSDYDAWVQGLLAKKGAAGTASRDSLSAASPSAAAAVMSRSPSVGPSLGGPGVMSPQASLHRTTSQLASPGSRSPLQHQASAGASGDLDKYERIAALLEGRGGAAGSSASGQAGPLSSRSISLTGSIVPAVASPCSRGGGLASTAKGSPARPSFR